MPAEQRALGFEHADLKFRILPDRKAIEGEATLTFTAKAPLTKLVLDFDRVFTIRKLTIDGQGAEAYGLDQARRPDDHHPAPRGGQRAVDHRRDRL